MTLGLVGPDAKQSMPLALIKIGAKPVRHGRCAVFQMAEVAGPSLEDSLLGSTVIIVAALFAMPTAALVA